jgi:hypothetical protein
MKNIHNLSMRFVLCTTVGLVLCVWRGGALYAQNASEIDAILESREVSNLKAAVFVLSAADLLPVSQSPSRAPQAADVSGSFTAAPSSPVSSLTAPLLTDPDHPTPIRLDELCFLIMKSFNIKGSFLYTLSPGPRYAYREMRYLKLIPEPSDPAMRVSGLLLMQIMEQVLHYSAKAD